MARETAMAKLLVPVLVAALAAGSSGCASIGGLGTLVAAPRFEQAADRQAELRLLPPGAAHPSGGAAIRIWTRIINPNPFSLTIQRLDGTLDLQGSRAASTEFPLGLPLRARAESTVPLDVSVRFADLPALGETIVRAATGSPIAFRIEGRVQVDAGQLGTPTFGPMTVLRGTLHVAR
jgi:hypothetical protein